MPQSVSDYYSLLDRAIADLSASDWQARRSVYERARRALHNQFSQPGLGSKKELDYELSLLEEAIACVETNRFNKVNNDVNNQIFTDNDKANSLIINSLTQTEHSRGKQFAFNTAASGLVSIVKMITQIFMIPVMARLLGPDAYSTYSIALPTVVFFVLIADGGLSSSLAREDETNRVFWSTAFWVLTITCVFMSIMVVCSGFVLARISGQSSLIGIMALLSLSLPILAFVVPADARLVRRGNLLYHSGSDLASTLVGSAIALILAFLGAGAWSLAVQYVVAFSIRAGILNYAAWSRPYFEFDFESLKGHLSIGGATLVTRLTELIGKVIENTLFGHIFGSFNLGAYTFSNQVARFASESITNPFIGSFYTHALHADDKAVAHLHARLCRLTMLLTLPVVSISAAVSPKVLPMVLGPKWPDAATYFQILVIPYAFASMSWLSVQILIKHGLVGRSAKVQVLITILRVSAVSAGFILPSSYICVLVGVSYLMQALGMILSVPSHLREDFDDLVRSLYVPIGGAAAAAMFSGWMIRKLEGGLTSIVFLAAGSLLIYLTVILTFGDRAWFNDVNKIRSLLARRLS